MAKSSRGFAPILILIILVAIAVVGYLTLKLPPGTTSSQPSPTPAWTQISNGVSYTNGEFGFFFQYPLNFNIQEFTVTPEQDHPKSIVQIDKTRGPEENYPTISLTVAQSNLSLSDWIESQNYCPDSFDSCTPLLPGPIADSIQFESINRHFGAIDTLFKKGDLIFNFSLATRKAGPPSKEERAAYQQILSTFKFLADTSDWKTYTNSPYQFSIKLPESLSILGHEDSSTNFIGSNIFYIISQVHPLDPGLFSPCQIKCSRELTITPPEIQGVASANDALLETYNIRSYDQKEQRYFSYIFYIPPPYRLYYGFFLINPDETNKKTFNQILSTFKYLGFLDE